MNYVIFLKKFDKYIKMKILFSLIFYSILGMSFSQTIDCNNVTYNQNIFYVSPQNNIITNTIFYNDSTSMIYPNHCLILEDSSLITVRYFTGLFNTGFGCHIFTHLTQNSTRDTLDFQFEVTFNSLFFEDNTTVNGNLILSDISTTGINPVNIILYNDTINSSYPSNIRLNKKVIKTVDFLGREINPNVGIPLIEIYDDGSIEKKIVIE